jgi:hypothetical protein
VKTLTLSAGFILVGLFCPLLRADINYDQQQRLQTDNLAEQTRQLQRQTEIMERAAEDAARRQERAEMEARETQLERQRTRQRETTPPVDLAGMSVTQKAHYIRLAASGSLYVYDSSGRTDARYLNYAPPVQVDHEAAARVRENDRVAAAVVREQKANEAKLAAEREQHQRELAALRAQIAQSEPAKPKQTLDDLRASNEYKRAEAESTKRSIAKYPVLGDENSPERAALQALVEEYWVNGKHAVFASASWPELMADKVMAARAAK